MADSHPCQDPCPDQEHDEACMETCLTMTPSASPTVASSNRYGDHGDGLPTCLGIPFTKPLLGTTQSTFLG